jgi:hypothetical protein
MYASATDLSTLGRAILSSKLIKPSLTRRWLNPVTFASDFLASVGAPWGVRRIQLAKETQRKPSPRHSLLHLSPIPPSTVLACQCITSPSPTFLQKHC